MKSLYVGMFAAIVTTLALSFVVFHLIADRMQKETIDPTFERADLIRPNLVGAPAGTAVGT